MNRGAIVKHNSLLSESKYSVKQPLQNPKLCSSSSFTKDIIYILLGGRGGGGDKGHQCRRTKSFTGIKPPSGNGRVSPENDTISDGIGTFV